MRETFLLIFNYVSHFVLASALMGLQASLWFQLFGYSPAPALWVLTLVYWALHRRNIEAFAMSYLIVFMLASLSGMPLTMLFLVVVTQLLIILLLKNRVLWSGLTHFTLASGISAFSVPLIVLFWSFLLETTPINDFHLFSWLLSPLLTALFAVILYPFFGFLDNITQKELPRDAETGLL